jgi:hypothetical protein
MKNLVCALIFGFLVFASITLLINPKLIGYDCEGKHLPQLANEESDFPQCAKIVRFRSR